MSYDFEIGKMILTNLKCSKLIATPGIKKTISPAEVR
jgi:hypothetical protein